MNYAAIAEALAKGVHVVQALSPIAAAFGGPMVAGVANTAAALLEVAENALKRAKQAGEVAAAENVAAITEIRDELIAENDRLAKLIADS